MLKTSYFGAIALLIAAPVSADITIEDAYARAASPKAKAGAAFMILNNTGTEDDRLLSASSDIAARVELHTHKDMGDGVMKMMEVEEGFVIPGGGSHALRRGADHVMFMGLKQALNQGDSVTVTLTFEAAGEVVVEVPVDLERKAGGMKKHGDMAGHSGHSLGH